MTADELIVVKLFGEHASFSTFSNNGRDAVDETELNNGSEWHPADASKVIDCKVSALLTTTGHYVKRWSWSPPQSLPQEKPRRVLDGLVSRGGWQNRILSKSSQPMKGAFAVIFYDCARLSNTAANQHALDRRHKIISTNSISDSQHVGSII